MGKAADEAALFERCNQTVNSGLGAQVQRILHFVETGRDTITRQPLVDEVQKVQLFLGQHARPLRVRYLLFYACSRFVSTGENIGSERQIFHDVADTASRIVDGSHAQRIGGAQNR